MGFLRNPAFKKIRKAGIDRTRDTISVFRRSKSYSTGSVKSTLTTSSDRSVDQLSTEELIEELRGRLRIRDTKRDGALKKSFNKDQHELRNEQQREQPEINNLVTNNENENETITIPMLSVKETTYHQKKKIADDSSYEAGDDVDDDDDDDDDEDDADDGSVASHDSELSSSSVSKAHAGLHSFQHSCLSLNSAIMSISTDEDAETRDDDDGAFVGAVEDAAERYLTSISDAASASVHAYDEHDDATDADTIGSIDPKGSLGFSVPQRQLSSSEDEQDDGTDSDDDVDDTDVDTIEGNGPIGSLAFSATERQTSEDEDDTNCDDDNDADDDDDDDDDASYVVRAPKARPPPPPPPPKPLLVMNNDKRNELAWARCAPRNHKKSKGKPISFPIPRPDDDEDEHKAKDDTAEFYSWYNSCGLFL